MTFKALCGNLFWSATVIFISAAVGYAQGSGKQSAPIIIDQTVAFSWPILLVMVMAAGGYVTQAVSMKAHHDNKALHITPEQAAEITTRPEICDIKHIAIMQQFAKHETIFQRIEDKLDKLTERVKG